MAGIRAGGIKYALGKQSAIGTRAIDEGLPLLEHTTPLPVSDVLRGVNTSKGQDKNYFRTGTVYYTARVRIPYAPAWVCRLLDLYFENTAVGSSPNYDRTYDIEDIPDEPSEWLTLWKYTAKTGTDHNIVGVGGVIYGVTIEGGENLPVTLSADIAFASREDDVATGTTADWDINESSGDADPIRNSDLVFSVGGSLLGVTAWSITLAHEFRAHFYASQNPHRITRRGYRVSGNFTIRDIDDDLEAFDTDFLDSSSFAFFAASGSNTFYCPTAKIHGPGSNEDRGTRYGTFNFTGLLDESAGTPALRIGLRPEIAAL